MQKTISLAADPEILAVITSIKEKQHTRNTSQIVREALRIYEIFYPKIP